jgi:hypothetical protein
MEFTTYGRLQVARCTGPQLRVAGTCPSARLGGHVQSLRAVPGPAGSVRNRRGGGGHCTRRFAKSPWRRRDRGDASPSRNAVDVASLVGGDQRPAGGGCRFGRRGATGWCAGSTDRARVACVDRSDTCTGDRVDAAPRPSRQTPRWRTRATRRLSARPAGCFAASSRSPGHRARQ